MFDKVGDLIQRLESASVLNRDDPALMSALAAAYLPREVSQLNQTLKLVTAASDFLPGGYALRVVTSK